MNVPCTCNDVTVGGKPVTHYHPEANKHNATDDAASSSLSSLPIRERIREIWRPLYDLGYKGAEQIDAQYMALLVTQATDEAEALLTSEIEKATKEATYKARLNLLLKLKQARPIDWLDGQSWIDENLQRLETLNQEGDSND